MTRAIQKFHVAMKAFIGREGTLLVVKDSSSGFWELPGGRIDVGEENIPHSEVLLRELREELGPNLDVAVERPMVSWTKRLWGEDGFVVLVGWRCDYRKGEVRLSDEHTEFRWVDPESWKALRMTPADQGTIQQYWDRVEAEG